MPRPPAIPSSRKETVFSMRPLCLGAVAMLSLATCLAAPALAFNFILISGGADQHLNWHWEVGYPVGSCQSNPTPCGDFASLNGMFSSSFTGIASGSGVFATALSGGELSWTGSDSLKIVARALTNAHAIPGGFFPAAGYAESWAALNARDSPLSFLMQAEAGDPATTNLKITPRLVGTFTNTTSPGGYASELLQALIHVTVNGVKATADTLFTDWEYVDGADGTRILDFPKGAVNTVMLPNVPANSIVTVTIWSYSRPYVTAPAALNALNEVLLTSPYGQGNAISVLAQTLGVTAVGPSGPKDDGLWLTASPNPATSAARIQYALPRPGDVRISIYDVSGHRVATLVEGFQEAGLHEVAWDGNAEGGRLSGSGLYLIELSAAGEKRVDKLAWAR